MVRGRFLVPLNIYRTLHGTRANVCVSKQVVNKRRGFPSASPPADNSASILTRRSSYSSLQRSAYLVPVVISDGDFPMQSSTNTLTVRVCTCDREGNMKLCNAEALTGRAGLSTGALVAILLCVIILLSEYMDT